MTADAGLAISRFVHFAALLFAFGVSFFPIYAFSGEERTFGMGSSFKTGLLSASLIAFASGCSWLMFTAATMSDSLSEALSPSATTTVLEETAFGRVWTVHLGLIITLCILAALNRSGRRPSKIVLMALCGVCLASLAGTGHTRDQDGLAFLVRVSADGAHLLAAGAWLGGLAALFAVLSSKLTLDHSGGEIEHLLKRFSGMGYGAVAVLVGTGLVNTWYLVPYLTQLPASLYGQLLIIKLGLFALMLFLAALNRFWLVPALAGPHADKSLFRLRTHVIGEQLLGILIIALVSVLGTLAPVED